MDRLFAAAAVALWACGGSAASGPSAAPTGEDPASLGDARDAACYRVAPRVTDCAVDSARRNMSPEEFADLAQNLDEMMARHTDEYIAECRATNLSRRQIDVYDTCPLDASCADFLTCMDRARPRR